MGLDRVLGEHVPFTADAELRQFSKAANLVCRLAKHSEQVGQENGEAGIGKLLRKPNHFGRDTRHLVHDDDGRTLTASVDGPFLGLIREAKGREVWEPIHRCRTHRQHQSADWRQIRPSNQSGVMAVSAWGSSRTCMRA
jgi:hypothetical protein